MDRKFLLILDRPTKSQSDFLTAFISSVPSFKSWHWIDNTWIITVDANYAVTPRFLWEQLIEDEATQGLRGIIFEVEGQPPYFGSNTKESWKWLSENWGPPKVVRDQLQTNLRG